MCPLGDCFFDWGGEYGLEEPKTVLSVDWEVVGWVLRREKVFCIYEFSTGLDLIANRLCL